MTKKGKSNVKEKLKMEIPRPNEYRTTRFPSEMIISNEPDTPKPISPCKRKFAIAKFVVILIIIPRKFAGDSTVP